MIRIRLVAAASIFLLVACGGPAVPDGPAPTDTPPAPVGTPAQPIDTPATVGDTPAPAPAGTLCHLVTLVEIESATGLPVELANEVEGQCTWLLKAPDQTSAGVVTLARDPGESGALAVYRIAFDGEDVAGVGDDAYWVEVTRTLFFVYRGETYFITMSVFGEDLDYLTMLRGLALMAISRI